MAITLDRAHSPPRLPQPSRDPAALPRQDL